MEDHLSVPRLLALAEDVAKLERALLDPEHRRIPDSADCKVAEIRPSDRRRRCGGAGAHDAREIEPERQKLRHRHQLVEGRAVDAERVDVAADHIGQEAGGEHAFGGAEAERAAAMPDIEHDAALARQQHLLANAPVGPHRRAEVLGSSLALLHPIAFAEPFGLSVVESMMCGTPTIAFALGSMPELIDHGTTGFLATGIEDAVDLVARAATLDRATCRRVAEERFSVSRMVDEYVAVYDGVIASASVGAPGL